MHSLKSFTLTMAAALMGLAPACFAEDQSPLAENPIIRLVQEQGITKFYAPDAVLVSFRDGMTDKQKLQAIRSYGLSLDPKCQSPYFARLIVPSSILSKVTLPALIEEMSKDKRFRYAETDNMIFPESDPPNDPSFPSQYAMNNTGQTGGLPDADVDALEGWDLVDMNAPPVLIAVCDDGFQLNHPDLAANFWTNPGEIPGNGIDDDGNGRVDDVNGWDFSDNDNNPAPGGTDTHGIHVTGIIAMVHNNNLGGAGVAKNVRVMPIRMYGGAANFISALANGVDYAWQNGAKVVSVSYNIDGYTQTLVDAIGRAKTADMVYCNSAGNNSQNIDSLRGAIRNVHNNAVFVASTTNTDALSSFSNFGQTVDIAAPGSDIYSTLAGSTYGLLSGTSMSTPCAAGIIGTIRQKFPALTAPQAILRLKNTADTLATLSSINGAGRANLSKALDDDAIPPSNPSGLEVCKRASTALKIRFLGSGDDGTVGSASSYEIRSSSSPITTANFNSAKLMTTLNSSAPAGSEVATTLKGFVPGSTVYLAVRAFDNVGNASAQVSAAGPVTLASVANYDDVEGASQWGGSVWGVTTAKSFSGTRSWTDSPSGNYANSINVILTKTTTVAATANTIFRFAGNFALENTWDFLYLEASTDGGTTWKPMLRYTGEEPVWKMYGVSLGAFAGQNVTLRFRMTTDSSVVRDGVYLDDFTFLEGQEVGFDPIASAGTYSSSTGWGVTTATVNSAPFAWADSPAGQYANSATNSLYGNVAYNTSGLSDAYLTFAGLLKMARGDDAFALTSVNGGSSWQQATRYTGIETAWGYFGASLPSVSDVRIGFQTVTNSSTTDDGIFVDDVRISGEPWLNSVSGTIDMDGYLGTSRPIIMKTYAAGTNTLLGTYSLTLSGTGMVNFSRSVGESSNVDLVFSGPGYLVKRIGAFNLANCDANVAVALVNGDIDNDNEIGPSDFSALSGAFGTSQGDPGYLAAADLDGDGEVGPSDFSILTGNFGETGD